MYCHLVDPLCILRGYDQFESPRYRSTLYFWWLYPCLSIQLWIRSVFYGGHTLPSLDFPGIGMPALGFEICHDIGWMFVCSFRRVLRVYTLAWTSTKYFSHQSASSDYILWGAFCYTSKSLNQISVAYASHVSQVSQSWLQVLQILFGHTSIMMTLRRHLKHLMHLVWGRRTGSLESNNS